jgi:uncharacterized membrane protein YdjX (TVP38/TMEM64 family)
MKDFYSLKLIPPSVLILGLFLFFYLDLDSFTTWNNITTHYSEIKFFTEEFFFYSVFIFYLINFFAVAFSLPIALLLLLLGGALFGWVAVFLSLFSTTIGCWVVFLAARGFLNEYLSKKVNPYLSSISSKFNKKPFLWLLSLKLFPLFPIWVGNIVPGILGIRSNTFLLATFIGFTPGTLIYVSFARGLDKILINGGVPNFSIDDNFELYIPLAIILLMSVTLYAIKFSRDKEENNL